MTEAEGTPEAQVYASEIDLCPWAIEFTSTVVAFCEKTPGHEQDPDPLAAQHAGKADADYGDFVNALIAWVPGDPREFVPSDEDDDDDDDDDDGFDHPGDEEVTGIPCDDYDGEAGLPCIVCGFTQASHDDLDDDDDDDDEADAAENDVTPASDSD